MEKNIIKEGKSPEVEVIVIPDECGDSMWDKVLAQAAFVNTMEPKFDGATETKTTKKA